MEFEVARRRMVDNQVRPNDVTSLEIINALGTVPREAFLPAKWRSQAYVERELPISEGRTLITARDFAKLLSAARPATTDIALDVACGGGYSSAVLSRLVEMVVATEADEAATNKAEATLEAAEVSNAAVVTGNPITAAGGQGPYDLILVAHVIEETPQALLDQLKVGGRLATILRSDGVSRGVTFVRTRDTFTQKYHFDAQARHVIPEFARAPTFVF